MRVSCVIRSKVRFAIECYQFLEAMPVGQRPEIYLIHVEGVLCWIPWISLGKVLDTTVVEKKKKKNVEALKALFARRRQNRKSER